MPGPYSSTILAMLVGISMKIAMYTGCIQIYSMVPVQVPVQVQFISVQTTEEEGTSRVYTKHTWGVLYSKTTACSQTP